MGALDGYKVLDFSTLLPGPYATMTLADLGAEVLKVSGRDKYDLVVNWPPVVKGAEVTGAQAWLGRGKKTIHLNLKKPAAVEAVKKLVMEYDIIVEQFRPGVMKKLGLSYEILRQVNPRIIYCSITGYGQTGPMSMRAGHDINYISRSGIAASAGRREGGPSLYNFQIADVAGGSLNAVASILAAIIYRERTGEGQYIDVSMQDSVVPFNSMDGAAYFAGGEVPSREGGVEIVVEELAVLLTVLCEVLVEFVPRLHQNGFPRNDLHLGKRPGHGGQLEPLGQVAGFDVCGFVSYKTDSQ